MHYVKHFNINGIATKQVACIELQGKPNTATEGSVGLLGIDMSSPLHEIYKCVAVNGNIYTWELFSSGLSIVSATISGYGDKSIQFPYDTLKTPLTYMVKPGDLIIDSNGYLYQIESLDAIACNATYCGTQVVAYGKSAYDLAVQQGFKGGIDEWLLSIRGEPGPTPTVGINNHWWVDGKDTGVDVALKTVVTGWYKGEGVCGVNDPIVINFSRPVKMLMVLPVAKGSNSNSDSIVYHPTDRDFDNSLIGYPENSPLFLFGTKYHPDNTNFVVTRFDTVVSWYADGVDRQRNRNEVIYEYIAFLGEENDDGTDYIDVALDNIIALQNELIGGEGK